MKPFNLADALAGKPVVTRDGEVVTGIAHLPSASGGYTVAAVVYDSIQDFREDGVWIRGQASSYDLFMAPEKVTVYVNIPYTSKWFKPQHYSNKRLANLEMFSFEKDAKQACSAYPKDFFLKIAHPIEIEV